MNHFWPVTCGGGSAGGCAVSGKVFSSLFPFFRMKIFSSVLGYCCEDALLIWTSLETVDLRTSQHMEDIDVLIRLGSLVTSLSDQVN